MSLSYLQLLQQLHALPASQRDTESFLRLFFQEDQIGSDQWNMALKTLTVDRIDLTVSADAEGVEGTLRWNEAEHCPEYVTGLGNVVQINKETWDIGVNKTGEEAVDGKVVYASGVQGNRLAYDYADARDGNKVSFVGVVTAPTGDNQEGPVTAWGFVNDLDTSAWVPGTKLYVAADDTGDLTSTPPAAPNFVIWVATVGIQHATQGSIFVAPRLDFGNGVTLTDLHTSTMTSGNLTAGNYAQFGADGSFTPKGTATFPSVVCLDYTNSTAARDAEENIHGDLHLVASGHDLSAGALTLTAGADFGLGKLVIVVNAGTDFDGAIDVLGTQVDRDTGTRTVSQTDSITVDTLTTDTSTADDGNGVTIHNLVNAYITSDWYTAESANIVISSSDTTITDIDVYHCSFEQFNDAEQITITTVDTNLFALAAAGTMSLYVYAVEVTGDKVDIQPFVSFMEGNTYFAAEEYYREPRRGNLNKVLSGTTDGFFISAKFGGINKFADIYIKVWATVLTTMP